jgi:hypothetical protein
MSGLFREIPTVKLGEELDDFEFIPATFVDLDHAPDLKPFVVKVSKPNNITQNVVAVVGALMMKREGELSHAVMVTGSEQFVKAKLEDIFLVDADLEAPDKKNMNEPDFDLAATMANYSERF